MQEQSRNEIGRRSIEVEEWKIAFPSRTWSDGDEAEWERGREWLREWAAIWAKSGGRWWRGREAEMRDVIERVSSEGEVESSKSDWNLREWGEDFKVSICFTCMLISPNNIVWEKKTKKRVQRCHLRLETKESCELAEPVMVHRIKWLNRSMYGSLLFFAWNGSSP